MITLLTGIPVRQTDANGIVAAGALLYTYAAGTTTPQATYTDSTGNTPLTDPILADAGGIFPSVWVSGLAYDFVCRDAAGNLLWQTLGYASGTSGTTFSNLAVTGTDSIVGTVTPVFPAYTSGQLFSFMAAGPNTTPTVTLNINGLGPVNIYLKGGYSVPIGRVIGYVQVVYNGTYFEYINPRLSKYTTGDLVPSFSSTAPMDTIAIDGTTIGDGSSGATSRANADTLALFTLLWDGANNTLLPIQNSAGAASTRGASAAVDFAAHKRMPVPTLIDGQAILAAVSSGVMTASLGALMAHTHTINDPGHDHAMNVTNNTNAGGSGAPGFVGTVRTGFSATGITINSAGTGGTSNLAAGVNAKVYLAL
jgi:hypothetical protein